jgi:uncharacterized protein (TIGR00369 family)
MYIHEKSAMAETAANPNSLSGLETMQAAIAGGGLARGIGKVLNFRVTGAEPGVIVIEGEPTADFLNPLGFVHGGWALTLLDSVTALAAFTTLPAGVGYTTLETKGNFVRAISPETGAVRAEGKVIAAGRTIITAEGRITDRAGKLLAHGTSTILVVRNDK